MRNLWVLCGLASVLVAAGCADSKWALFRNHQSTPRASANPKADDLVAYINGNARQLRSIQCPYLDMTCRQGIQQFGLRGQMVCEQPRNFRLVGTAVAKTEVDIGSNKDEFWYYIARAEPPTLVHCAYSSLAQGVRVPFPFQPEWIMEALGMAELPPDRYQLVTKEKTYELIRESVSQGQKVQKVTIFSRDPSSVQVREHALRDARGKDICTAQILDAQSVGNIVVPRKVQLDYPAENLHLRMQLYVDAGRDLIVNRPLEATVFLRPNLANIPSYDLAYGPDNPNQIRRAGTLP
jgi:hypothetical protein